MIYHALLYLLYMVLLMYFREHVHSKKQVSKKQQRFEKQKKSHNYDSFFHQPILEFLPFYEWKEATID